MACAVRVAVKIKLHLKRLAEQGLTLSLLVVLLAGCATYRPTKLDDACHILVNNKSWYKASVNAANRWGTPIATQLAFIHQESRFVANAKPPRSKILGFIPGPRPSDAFGYGQIKKATWRWYQQKTGVRRVRRNEFADVALFISWYNQQSHTRLGIGLGDPYRQYLAYHEGHGGYERKTFRQKPWLLKVAKKVAVRAKKYQQQIKRCKKQLEKKRFWIF